MDHNDTHTYPALPIRLEKGPDALLDNAFDEFASRSCTCAKCGAAFNVSENHLYACQGHTGELVLDSVGTVRNIAIGVAIGALVGTGFGALAGLLFVGKVAAAGAATSMAANGATMTGLATAATVTSGYTVTSGAAAAAAPAVVGTAATGAAVGSTVGGAGGTMSNLVYSIGAYRWSCCGSGYGSSLCRGRTSMHTPKPEVPGDVSVLVVHDDLNMSHREEPWAC